MAYFELTSGVIIESDDPHLWKGEKRLAYHEGKRRMAEQAREALLKLVKPNSTVYTALKSVSRSGMSRTISAYVVADGRIVPISGYVATVLGWRRDDKTGGIKVTGVGMDAGFHLVYSLGLALWPVGTPEPHGYRNGKPDSDGGYALRHEWL